MLFNNIFSEMASRARSSARRLRRINLLLFIYLFICINQGHGIELTSIYKSADHYWPLRNVSDNTSVDVVGLAHASIQNGAKLNKTSLFGPAIMLDGLDDCIILDLLSEDCTNNPTKCHDGFTISFWLYYIRGEFLLCTGTYTNKNKGPGIKFTFDEKSNLFILEISTLKLTWKVTTRMVRLKWVHVAFTWSEEEGIHLYLNGNASTKQESAKYTTFETPKFSHGWSLGRPNELLKLTNYGNLGISHLALWLRELTDVEIMTAYLETIVHDPEKVIAQVSEMVDGKENTKNITNIKSPTARGRSKATSLNTFGVSWLVNGRLFPLAFIVLRLFLM